MTAPYLIQRLKFKDSSFNKSRSFDEAIECEYMGSAEFEFGELPKSLKQFTKNIDRLRIDLVPTIKSDTGYRLCIISFGDDYIHHALNLFNDKYRLKEHMYTQSKMTDKCLIVSVQFSPYVTIDMRAWWDIDNHVMMTFGKDNANKIVDCIKEVRTRKEKSGDKNWL